MATQPPHTNPSATPSHESKRKRVLKMLYTTHTYISHPFAIHSLLVEKLPEAVHQYKKAGCSWRKEAWKKLSQIDRMAKKEQAATG